MNILDLMSVNITPGIIFQADGPMATTRIVLLYLTLCEKGWLVIYLPWVLINTALTSLAFHLMGTGTEFLICLVAMMELPTPDKDLLKKVLGEEVNVDPQDDPASPCLGG